MIPARPHDPDKRYEHRYHAGNVGDVLKHLVLVEVVNAMPAAPSRLFVDTHAAAGFYRLAPQGEWTEGLGRVSGVPRAALGTALQNWLYGPPLAKFRQPDGSFSHYPGSPLWMLSHMGAADRLVAVEREEAPRAELQRRFQDDARVEVRDGDGLQQGRLALESFAGPALVHIDPAYADKAEWDAVADAMVAMHAARPGAWLLLWYPYKGFSRPPALQRRLAAAGVAFTAWDLITSPVEDRRNRLHGSGMLLVGGTDALRAHLSEVVTSLGRWLAHGNEWSLRVTGQKSSSTPA